MWRNPKYRKQGVAKACCNTLINTIKRRGEINTIYYGRSRLNFASDKLALSLGFEKQTVDKKYVVYIKKYLNSRRYL